MITNFRKSTRMALVRVSTPYMLFVLSSSNEQRWLFDMRYLWVWSVSSKTLKCEITNDGSYAIFLRTKTHNFINLLKRQHNYTQKNESENLTNQQHKTLKRYLTQLTQWRHIMFSEAENSGENFLFSAQVYVRAMLCMKRQSCSVKLRSLRASFCRLQKLQNHRRST